jgi:hypothetical protein
VRMIHLSSLSLIMISSSSSGLERNQTFIWAFCH